MLTDSRTIAQAYGLGQKVFSAGEVAGMTPELWNALAQDARLFAQLPAMIRGSLADALAEQREQQPKFFTHIATTNLAATVGKKTRKCFVGSRYTYRDNDFDNWLPANQPSADACVITTLASEQDWTFAEAAAKVLGVGAGTNIILLGKALIENGHIMTLAQAEEMIEANEHGENTGMHRDGRGNFFFVETEDENNPVSVGGVGRVERAWVAYVGWLVSGDRWDAGGRLLVRNLDASKL